MSPANLIDGRTIARQLQGELVQRIAALKAIGVQPGLAFVRVGEDPASKVYVGRKEKTCAELGIFSETHVLPEGTREAELLGLLGRLNTDPRLHGILVQAPLPPHIRSAAAYGSLVPSTTCPASSSTPWPSRRSPIRARRAWMAIASISSPARRTRRSRSAPDFSIQAR